MTSRSSPSLPASAFAAESGHWYCADGTPCYTVRAKDGSERPTTLRDARKLSLVPSVTTIIRCAAAPGLERWKAEQLMLAALTLPRGDGEAESAWLTRVQQDSRETARKAADRGTEIHGAIERLYRGESISGPYVEHTDAACSEIAKHCGAGPWLPERSFAHWTGYGGKCDLHSPGWVIDYKSKEFSDPQAPTLFDEHFMQLAAYRRGLGVPKARCAILFVSASSPGLVAFREAQEADLVRGLAMFDALLTYWQAKAAYRPALAAAA